MPHSTERLPYASHYRFERVVVKATRLGVDAYGMAIVLGLDQAQRAHRTGTVYESGVQLAARAHVKLRTFWRRVKTLEASGAVRVLHGGGRGKLPDGSTGGFANGYQVDPDGLREIRAPQVPKPAPPAPRRPMAEELERVRARLTAEHGPPRERFRTV